MALKMILNEQVIQFQDTTPSCELLSIADNLTRIFHSTANSATSSASGSNSNLSGSTSASASAATSPTSSGTAVGGILSGAPKSPPGLGSSTPISVRFNANEESLDDILQSFHHSKHSPSGGASGGGDASPTSNLLGMKNNGLGLVVGNCDSLSSSPSQPQMHAGSASLFGVSKKCSNSEMLSKK